MGFFDSVADVVSKPFQAAGEAVGIDGVGSDLKEIRDDILDPIQRAIPEEIRNAFPDELKGATGVALLATLGASLFPQTFGLSSLTTASGGAGSAVTPVVNPATGSLAGAGAGIPAAAAVPVTPVTVPVAPTATAGGGAAGASSAGVSFAPQALSQFSAPVTFTPAAEAAFGSGGLGVSLQGVAAAGLVASSLANLIINERFRRKQASQRSELRERTQRRLAELSEREKQTYRDRRNAIIQSARDFYRRNGLTEPAFLDLYRPKEEAEANNQQEEERQLSEGTGIAQRQAAEQQAQETEVQSQPEEIVQEQTAPPQEEVAEEVAPKTLRRPQREPVATTLAPEPVVAEPEAAPPISQPVLDLAQAIQAQNQAPVSQQPQGRSLLRPSLIDQRITNGTQTQQ